MVYGKTLYRIKALIAFGNVRVGDVGGFVECEANLSHDSNAWVSVNAQVLGNALVYDNAHSTKAVLNINYEKYNITATDNHLKIGCEQHTFDEWANFDDDTISNMDDVALMWWKKWKPIIFAILEVEGCPKTI